MKKIYLLASVFISITCFGQLETKSNDKYAPHGITTVAPSNNNTPSQKISYYSENFDNGFGEWVAETQTGAVDFTLTNSGHLNNAGSTFFIPTLSTSTPTQWVVLDSDAFGSSGVLENATLTSGRIDLTSAGGQPLKIAFDQFMAEWTNPVDDSCLVGISTDSISWTEYSVNDGVGREGRPNPETVLVNISNDYTANEDSVWIRFRWYGQFNYGWQIDNVRIEDLPLSDLSVDKVYTADITTGYEYSMIPETQATSMTVGAVVKNQGLNDQTSVNLTATLTGDVSGQVAQNSTAILALNSFSQDTFWVDLAYTPTSVETYTVSFEVPTDDNTVNDSSANEVEITDYLYSHYRPSGSIIGYTDTNETVAIGTVFTIENDVTLYEVQAQFAEGSAIDTEFRMQLHEVNNNSVQETTLLIDEPFMISASDTLSSSGWKIMSLVDPTDLVAGGSYIIEFLTYDAGLERIYMRSNPDGNADLSTTVYGPFGTNSAVNRYVGWGYSPAIRLNLDPSLSVENLESDLFLGQNTPNPFGNSTTINYMVNSTNEVSFKIVDMTGKTVMNINEGIKTAGSYSININAGELAEGMYFYTLSNGTTSLTKSMTITK